MAQKLIQTKKTTLAYGISDSATTFRLTNLLKLDGSAMSASDIGDILYGTFDPGTSREEIFSIAGANVTVNSDGTVDITSAVRGLQEVSPYSTGGFATDHPAGAVVVFGNNPQLFNTLAFLANAQTFSALQTFTLLPKSNGGNATEDTQLVTYLQAVNMLTGGSLNRIVVSGTGGAVLVAGDAVYLDSADNEWKKTDADTSATVNNVIKGIAQGAGTDGGAITNGVLLFGMDSNQSGLTPGAIQYFSNTAGDFSETPGTVEVTAGQAKSATEILFYPSFNQQLTEDQQDLLEKLVLGTDFYGASVVGTDSYAITITPTVAYTNGIRFRFKADVGNTGACSLNVNGLGAITIKKNHDQDLATGDIEANQIIEVMYNSTGPVFEMTSQTSTSSTADVQVFTADGTWTKPSGAKSVQVIVVGAGGGGGSGDKNSNSNERAGSGGGGGAVQIVTFDASDLDATEAVVVGEGGAGGAGQTSVANGNNGTAGELSSFGTRVKAGGGGGGLGGVNNSTVAGGGGGGSLGSGSGATGGVPTTSGGNGISGQGVTGANAQGYSGEYGGGAGGGTGNAGGSSIYGAGGGGAGGPPNGTGTSDGFAGGTPQAYTSGGGGAAGTSGGAGTAGSANSVLKKGYGGAGGGGGGGSGAGTSGAGGAGGIPGGGGGGSGAGSNSQSSGAGGAGARGQVTVITYF